MLFAKLCYFIQGTQASLGFGVGGGPWDQFPADTEEQLLMFVVPKKVQIVCVFV